MNFATRNYSPRGNIASYVHSNWPAPVSNRQNAALYFVMLHAFAMTLLLAAATGSVGAIEFSAVGSQATQANVNVLNSKIDTAVAALQTKLDQMTACEAQRKFYAPSDPKKDANGCVGVGDYDLNMASGNNVNFANGRVYATQGVAGNYGGLFYGNDHGVYGVGSYVGLTGTASGNGYGVMGNATASSGGVGGQFSGGNSGVRAYGSVYGLLGQSSGANSIGVRGDAAATSSWGGYFTGYYGLYAQGDSTWAGEFYGTGSGTGSVYIGNSYNNAQLCLNGNCVTSLGGQRFGGAYATKDDWCYSANPQTGGCSCPSGYGSYMNAMGFSHITGFICQK